MDIKYLDGMPCLIVGDSLIVGDLHNGIEHELLKKGVIVPSQTQRKLQRLISAVQETNAKRLIILGDLKHNVPVTSAQEYREVPQFLSNLQSAVSEIIITKGNHDGDLEKMVPKGVTVSSEFFDCSVGFFHGHTKPSDRMLASKIIIKAHTHPSVMLQDLKSYVMPVWVETRLKYGDSKVIVVPAFDENARGIALNLSEPVGPLMKSLADLENAELYLLDGSYVGTIGELRATGLGYNVKVGKRPNENDEKA